jgi:hypothetical protein
MSARSQSKEALAEGQLWKTPAADIEIVALGKGLIHYKVTPQFGLREVNDQISAIAALDMYLKTHGGKLVRVAPRE